MGVCSLSLVCVSVSQPCLTYTRSPCVYPQDVDPDNDGVCSTPALADGTFCTNGPDKCVTSPLHPPGRTSCLTLSVLPINSCPADPNNDQADFDGDNIGDVCDNE